MAEDDAITANDIGEAIRRGVALLEQQSVPAPTFKLRRVLDVYEEGIRAAKSRAPANRIRQAWVDAAGELPPPMPATVERALEELGDESTVAEVIAKTYEVMTAAKLAKAQSRRLAPNLAVAASTNVPRDGAGARLALSAVIKAAQEDIVASGVLMHRDTANIWIKLHAEACAASIRDDALRSAFVDRLGMEQCKLPHNASWAGKPAFTLWEAEVERVVATLEADYSLIDMPATKQAKVSAATRGETADLATGGGPQTHGTGNTPTLPMYYASVRRAVKEGHTTVTEFTVDDASAMRLQDWVRADGIRNEAVVAKRPLDGEPGSRIFLLHKPGVSVNNIVECIQKHQEQLPASFVTFITERLVNQVQVYRVYRGHTRLPRPPRPPSPRRHQHSQQRTSTSSTWAQYNNLHQTPTTRNSQHQNPRAKRSHKRTRSKRSNRCRGAAQARPQPRRSESTTMSPQRSATIIARFMRQFCTVPAQGAAKRQRSAATIAQFLRERCLSRGRFATPTPSTGEHQRHRSAAIITRFMRRHRRPPISPRGAKPLQRAAPTQHHTRQQRRHAATRLQAWWRQHSAASAGQWQSMKRAATALVAIARQFGRRAREAREARRLAKAQLDQSIGWQQWRRQCRSFADKRKSHGAHDWHEIVQPAAIRMAGPRRVANIRRRRSRETTLGGTVSDDTPWPSPWVAHDSQADLGEPTVQAVHDASCGSEGTARGHLPTPRDSEVNVVCKLPRIIAPLSEAMVPVQVQDQGFEGDIVVDATSRTPELHVGACIQNAQQFKAIRVLNSSHQRITIQPGTVVARGQRVCVMEPPKECDNKVATHKVASAHTSVSVGKLHSKTSADEDMQVTDTTMEERLQSAQFEHDVLREDVRQFPAVFSNTLRATHMAQMRIPTQPGCVPAYVRPRRQSRHEVSVLKTEIARLQRLGVVEPANSLWCSPMVLVSKKPLPDGSPAGWRVVSDFRQVNDRLAHVESFPIPDIRDTLSSLEGKTIFSALDALHGYWSVPIQPEDRHKTAFIVDGEQFQYKRMGMGLSPSSAVFQRMMSAILAHIPNANAYIDDILIASSSLEEHREDLRNVLQSCQDAGISIKPAKCKFGFSHLKYLGYHISGSGTTVDDDTIQALREKPDPSNKKEAQRLLGLLTWARPFVVGFSALAKPIIEVAKPSHRWSDASWGHDQHRARRRIMQQLERRTMMAHPTTGAYKLFTDASSVAVGAVLTQRQGQHWVPIAFHSRLLNDTEQKYSVTELEALAVLDAVRKFRYYLHGPKPFEVITDHSALQYVQINPEKSEQLTRWRSALLEFNMKIVHRPGKELAFVDYLSRPPFPSHGKWRKSSSHHGFKDTLDSSHEYLASSRQFAAAAAKAGRFAKAAVLTQAPSPATATKDTTEVSLWSAGASCTAKAVIDSGAEISVAAWEDLNLDIAKSIDRSDRIEICGIGSGTVMSAGSATVQVGFQHGPRFQCTIHVAPPGTPVDSRGILLGVDVLDQHGITRRAGTNDKSPSLEWEHDGSHLATLHNNCDRTGMVAGVVRVAVNTRSQRRLRANQTPHSSNGSSNDAQTPVAQPQSAETRALPRGDKEATNQPPMSSEAFADAQRQDPEWGPIIQCGGANADTTKASRHSRWMKQHKFSVNHMGVLTATNGKGDERVCLPGSLRPFVLQQYHDSAGHFSGRTTAQAISATFTWPLLDKDVNQYVSSCELCRSRHPSSRGLHSANGFCPEPERNFDVWHADISGPLQLRNQRDNDDGSAVYNVSFICRLSRWVESAAIVGKSASEAFSAFTRTIVARYGTPVAVTTDNGKEFMGTFADGLKAAGIRHHFTTPLSHTGNSIIERYHRIMWDRLAFNVPENNVDWQKEVSVAASQYNMSVPQSGASPYESVFGQRHRTLPEAAWAPFMRAMSGSTTARIAARNEHRAEERARRARRRASGTSASFKAGDEVWALRPPPQNDTEGTTAKMRCLYAPATIISAFNPATKRYRLRFSDGEVTERGVQHIRHRPSRKALMDAWNVPYLEAPMDQTQLNAKARTRYSPNDNTRVVDRGTARAAKAGDTVVVALQYKRGRGVDTATIPDDAVPTIGTILRISRGVACIQLPDNAAGESQANVLFNVRNDRCLGVQNSIANTTMRPGEWALVNDVDCKRMPIGLVIGWRRYRDFLGRPTTTWRVRQTGFGPDADIVDTAPAIASMFPGHNVDAALVASIGHMVDE